jgi:hypothetical protein
MGGPPPSPPVVYLTPSDASVGVGSNQSSVFTATIAGGQLATIKFYYDSILKQQTYGNSASYSTPAGDTTTAGNHIVRVVASNANGTSEAFAYWHIVSTECVPYDDRIQFYFGQYRIRVNGIWSAWKTAYCNENGIARFGFGSEDKNEFSTDLDNIEWRKDDSTCENGIVSFRNPNGPNQKLYLVSSSRNGHAMVAEYLGRDDTPEHFDIDRQVWTNWRFFQYGEEHIIPEEYVNPSNPQMPYGAPNNFITIRRVTSIYFTPDGTPKYVGTTVAQFTINGYGDRQWNYPFAEFEY